MRKLYFIALIIIIFAQNVITTSAKSLDIPADSAYMLIDSKTGQVITEHNADMKLRPASTTKIMTAILALENGKLDQIMNVSKEAVYDIGEGGMNIGIMPGEDNLTLENLLNVMLIKSANETANIIAENIGGSKNAFIDMMNKKAAELGASNTHFVNPCGKDDAKEDANHLSTARDMAAIARYAMTLPKFREIVSKEYYNDIPVTNKHKKWDYLRTTNKLLWSTNAYTYTIDNMKHSYTVNGIKTGYTSAAGHNLISSAINEDGMELIAVIMHTTDANKVFNYDSELLKYGFEHFTIQKIIDANQVVKSIVVDDAKDIGKLDMIAASDFSCTLPIDKNDWNIVTDQEINLPIKAPVSRGDVLGYVEYKRNDTVLGRVDVIASLSVEKNTGPSKTEKMGNMFRSPIIEKSLAILLALLGFLLLRLILRKISRKINKKRIKGRKI